MSLIEVLIAAGLMALVAAGLTGTIVSMNKEQNNQIRLATLREMKTRIQFLITDQNSWNKTMQQNANMNCLLTHGSCTPGGTYDLKLNDPSGTVFLDPPPWATTPVVAGNGFTDKGVSCLGGFNGAAGAGSDACPISYKIVWEPVCVAPCKNPLVRVTARLLYNPSPTAQVPSFALGSATIANNEAGAGKYDVVIKRSGTTINKSFSMSIKVASAAGGKGGGDCPSAWTTRGSNVISESNGAGAYPIWSIDDDNFGLVTKNDSTGAITIQPGTYSCKITAVAWAVDNFKIQLYRDTAPVGVVTGSEASANASTTSYAQSVATSSPLISIAAATTYRLQQYCQNPTFIQNNIGPVPPNGNQYQMGLTAKPYTDASTFATFTCSQTN